MTDYPQPVTLAEQVAFIEALARHTRLINEAHVARGEIKPEVAESTNRTLDAVLATLQRMVD